MIKASELQKYIGNQVRRFRKLQGLSQEMMAEKIGISTNSLSSIETGNAFMTINTLEKILNVLKISPKELFDFPEIQTPKVDKKAFIKEAIKKIQNDEEKIALLYNFLRILAQ